MFRKLQVLILLILIPVAGVYMYLKSEGASFGNLFAPRTPIMHVGEIPIRVTIVETETDRIQGLSGKEKLSEVEGMLFVFPESDYHGMWMKDMHFAIDIVWVDEDLSVVSLEKNVTPDSYPRTFRPSRPAKYVLETSAHYTETFGINVGDTVRLPIEISSTSTQ